MSDRPLPALDRALVVGLGRSGVPVVRALLDTGVEVVAADSNREVSLPPAIARRVELHVGATDDAVAGLVDGVDLVVPSPGVPEGAPVLGRALDRSVTVWSEPELGYRLAPRQIIGVTGTNGKTTVTELTAKMLADRDRPVIACGNIGNVFTDAARSSPGDALLVAELSSFQLRFVDALHPAVGVLLNLAPDHLDWHADMESYAAAKARIWAAQGGDDWAVGNADEPRSADLVRRHAPGRVAWVSADRVPAVGVGVADGVLTADLPTFDGPLLAVDELPLAAPHHIANVAAAAAAALLAGADPAPVAAAARRFRPGAHRLELVGERGGVRYVDDSKATNPHAAVAALRATADGTGGIVWIAGGLAKGLDLRPLGAALAAVRHVVLIGAAADRLGELAGEHGVPATRAATMEEAVRAAADHAEPGDTVLLAPACASFDQFVDYADRGDRFAAAVSTLGRRRPGGRGR